MSDWRTTKLGEAADFTLGFPFKSAKFSENPGDIRLLRGDNVAQRRVRWDNAKRWPKAEFDALHQFHLAPGDIILAMDRPWIEAGLKWAVLSPADCPSLLVQRVLRLRAKPGVTQRFLGHVLASRAFTEHVLGVQTGTAVPHISGKQVADFTFNLPALPEQERIAEILSTLDDKIELNRRMNETLEAMAQAIFRDWFVDFGPVRRKLAGATDPVAIMGGLIPDPARAAEMAGLFNVDQVLELSGPLSKFARVEWGNTTLTKAAYTSSGFPAYSAAGPDGLIEKAERSGVGTIISAIGTVDKIYLAHGRWTAIKNTLTVQSNEQVYRMFIHFWLRSQPIPTRGSTQQFISLGDLRALKIALPKMNLAANFDAVVSDLFDRVWHAEEENLTLAETRDYLLPRLMSGEVRVGDVEAMIT